MLGFAAIVAGIGSPSALAQLGLPDTNGTVTSATSQATEMVQQTVEIAAPVVDTATQTTDGVTQNANASAAPVVESTTKTVDEVTKTATQTVAPVVQQVEETVTTIVPAAEAVTPVVEGLVETVGSTVGTAGKTVDRTRSAVANAELTHTAATPASSEPASAAPTTGASADQQVATVVTNAPPDKAATATGRTPRPNFTSSTAPKAELPMGVIPISSAPAGDLGVTTNGAAPPSYTQPRSPLPGVPSGPLTALFGASASAGGGSLVAFLAALAAALFLAAPGLGRRLRLRLASWPQPIPHLSLERPG